VRATTSKPVSGRVEPDGFPVAIGGVVPDSVALDVVTAGAVVTVGRAVVVEGGPDVVVTGGAVVVVTGAVVVVTGGGVVAAS
jgi:hypothetical protein